MTAPSTKEVICSCGLAFSYVPKFYDGREVFAPQLCDDCERIEFEARERAAAEGRRHERAIVWNKLGMAFQTPETRTVLSKLPASRAKNVMAWRYNPKGPFCWGDTGLAKTRSIIELLRRLWIEEGIEFNFVQWAAWQGKLDQAPKFGAGMQSKEVTPLINVPFLVFDDCLKGRPNESIATAFFQVIDGRSSRGLPTGITTRYQLTREDDGPFEKRLAIGHPDVARDLCRRLREYSSNQPFVKDQ